MPDAGPPGKTTQFKVPLASGSTAAVTLEGLEYGDGTRAVVLAPSAGGTQDEWTGFAKTLAARGFHVFTYNGRGSGLSEGDSGAPPSAEDLASVGLSVQGRRTTTLALIGAGRSGLAAIAAGATIKAAAAIGLSASGDASTIKDATVPALLIAAEEDPDADPSPLASAMARRPAIERFGGAERGAALLYGIHAPDVRQVIFDFLVRYLGG